MRIKMLLAAAAIAAGALASGASAGSPSRFTIHDEYAFVDGDFCGSGLTVAISGVLDIRGQIVTHGRDRLEYFAQHGTQAETLTANGRSLTSFAKVNEKDLRVTDNGDGTMTVLILATGNAVLYDQNGKAIARNPGQTRFVIVFDANGNEVPGSRQIVKGSTGRSDDFCDAAVPALT